MPLPRRRLTRSLLILVLTLILLAEILHHNRKYRIPRPTQNLDEPFNLESKCQPPSHPAPKRQDATFFMLARNSELQQALTAITTLESHFNKNHHYPILFANNEPFSPDFISTLTAATSGRATFATIPSHMWSYPNNTSPSQIQTYLSAMQAMSAKNIIHAGNPHYHHMCRFHSGFFFDLPEMEMYNWYWRVEPDSRYTCDIPYDPFHEMASRNKKYGYAIALWEVGRTAPSLFRTVDDYRREKGLAKTSAMWTSMLEASWAPRGIREWVMGRFFPSRDRDGDGWNLCHFWSNFEVADLSFYRSQEYREFFARLDESGGFHMERWGDAAVHSLAAGLFLRPEELHYFEDVGYRHGGFQHCPRDGLGCGCECKVGEDEINAFCLDRLRESVVAL